MHQIQSSQVKVSIESKGAELKSIYHKTHGLEYMWSGDPAFWAKTSPVLFPIVGTLKNNQYFHDGHSFTLGRHGFARDRQFAVTQQSETSIKFTIEADENSLAVYPFKFRFNILYSLEGERLTVQYLVENTGEKTMLFSVGGHRAFKLPLVQGTAYEDYQLVFDKEENAGRWPISKDGLIEKSSQPLLNNSKVLPLDKDLFQKDAVVFKHLNSSSVQLTSPKTDHGLRFNFEGFPFLGLWAATGADFLCIEPWCGIADSVDSDQQLKNKEGIISLSSGKEFAREWKVNFF